MASDHCANNEREDLQSVYLDLFSDCSYWRHFQFYPPCLLNGRYLILSIESSRGMYRSYCGCVYFDKFKVGRED